MRLPYIVLLLLCSGITALVLVSWQGTWLPAGARAAPAESVSPTPAPPGGIVHGLLYEKHLAAGVPCAGCHTENPPAAAADASTCLNCHGPVSALIAKTAGDTPNPHAQAHIGPVPCTACHHIHIASESYCNKCHTFDMNVP
jgi:hypothetical protein